MISPDDAKRITTLSADQVSKLPDEAQSHVNTLIGRHVDACHKLEVEPEDLGRVAAEAYEDYLLKQAGKGSCTDPIPETIFSGNYDLSRNIDE